MLESFIATFIFWSTFVFSIGPFWIMIMELAKTQSLKFIYKNYTIYLVLGWLPQLILIGFVVDTIGAFHPYFITILYFLGTGVIIYMALATLKSKKSKLIKIVFNWKAMILLSWSNPKVWLVVPAGFLTANYTSNTFLDIILCALIGFPLFISGLFFWAMIGRQGIKIAKEKMSYFNAFLLFAFASYLFYQGIKSIQQFL